MPKKLGSLLVLVVLLLVPCSAFTQPTWKRVYGGAEADRPFDVKVANDGGFVLLASTGSFGASSTDAYLLKLDENGERTWSVVIGGQGIEEARSFVQTDDGGFLLVGTAYGANTEGYDGWVVRTDENGSVIWDRFIGGTDWDHLRSIAPDGSGGYWLAGVTYSTIPGPRAWLLRIAQNGATIAERTYSISSEAWSVRSTPDGGCVMAGSVDGSNGVSDAYVIKVSATLDMEWEARLGGEGHDSARDIILTADGGYSIIGSTRSFATVVEQYHVRLTGNGEEIWFRHWGQVADQEGSAHVVLPSGDFASIGYVSQGGAGGTDMFLLKSDASGDFILGQTQGGPEDERGVAIAKVEGGYLMCGWTESYGSGSQDLFVVRTNEVGFTASDDVISQFDPVGLDPVVYSRSFVHPNPSFGTIDLLAPSSSGMVRILDATGRVFEELPFFAKEVHLDLNAPTGQYCLQLVGANGSFTTTRITILRP